MFCPSCGHDNIEGVDRCEECMTPLLALLLSLLVEGFRPDLLTFCGLALAVIGNVLMLSPALLAGRRLRGGAPAAE